MRDTVTDKFVTTYKAGEPKPDLAKLAPTRPAAYANRPPDQLNVKKPRGARLPRRRRVHGRAFRIPAPAA